MVDRLPLHCSAGTPSLHQSSSVPPGLPPAVDLFVTTARCVDQPLVPRVPLPSTVHPLHQVFLPAHGKLVTSSKDGSLRVWDLAGQRCSQVVTGFKAEVWSLDANAGTTRLVAGGSYGAWCRGLPTRGVGW
jgi:hypothetical protein